MRRLSGIDRLAVLAVILALALPGTSCNVPGNQNKDSEAIVQGTAITYLGTSMAATTVALTVSVTFSVITRQQGTLPESLLNSIQFETMTITAFSPIAGVSVTPITGIFYQTPSAGNVIIITLSPAKSAANVSYNGHVHLDGHDNLGRPVSYDFDYGTATTL